jgi:hypothetical protein
MNKTIKKMQETVAAIIGVTTTIEEAANQNFCNSSSTKSQISHNIEHQ